MELFIISNFKKYLGLILFFISFLIALMTYSSYGLSWDESVQRHSGYVSFNYVFHNEFYGDHELDNWEDKDYGVAFELPLFIIEKIFSLSDSRDIYLMRHLVTHLFFLISCYYLYLIIDTLYKSKILALLGFLILITSPSIYSHSFFNSKDIPFLSFFIISLYYYLKAFRFKSIKAFVKLGICVGILINLRLMGILLFFGTFCLLLLDLALESNKKKHLYYIFVFIFFSLISLYLTWPFLWKSPIENFIFAFNSMSKFRWDGPILFQGKIIKASKIEWNYIPIWFTINTPIINLILGTLGVIILAFNIFKSPMTFIKNTNKRINLVFFIYFLSPVLAIILLKSVIYDSWRQMFFIYPSFILIIIYGISNLLNKKLLYNYLIYSLLTLSFILSISYNIVFFPNQGIYFNEYFFFSKPGYLKKQYEMDYWGVSYKQALEYILKNDNSSIIPISVDNFPGQLNLEILPKDQRYRFKLTNIESSKYFISNYRFQYHDYEEYKNYVYYNKEILNNIIISVFQLNNHTNSFKIKN